MSAGIRIEIFMLFELFCYSVVVTINWNWNKFLKKKIIDETVKMSFVSMNIVLSWTKCSQNVV